jgi:thymidylate synthase (FAD)
MPTIRPNSPYLDSILGDSFPVLDKGWVRPIDYMGTDQCIEFAARMSNGDGTRKVSDTAGLINYLTEHGHTSPIEMVELKIWVRLPIFVARQWIRTRCASANEESARYSIMTDEFYLPPPEQIAGQSKSNKQGRGDVLDLKQANEVLEILKADALRCQINYRHMLDTKRVARELARINVTLNTYTQWVWKIDLHNLFKFIQSRMNPHAQWEIQEYAQCIYYNLVKPTWPLASDAFEEFNLYGMTLSRTEQEVVRMLFEGQQPPKNMLKTRQWDKLERLGIKKSPQVLVGI